MILGISGKIGSGKDLIGSIIQYLTWKNKVEKGEIPLSNYSLEDFLTKGYDSKGNLSGWQIRKFADKLKDIVCLLIGCTREQLEDREFKDKELGEEWWQYGLLRSGTRKPILFPSKLEDIEKQLKMFEESTLYIDKLTPRKLLQLLGTECGRQIIHENIWVNATMADYKPFIENYPNLIKSNGKDLVEGKDYSMGKAIYPNWIITDCRFPNEADAIKERKGIIIRVNTDYIRYPNGSYRAKNRMMGDFDNEHKSETALDNYQFDYVINNNFDIPSLIEKVKEILIKEKII